MKKVFTVIAAAAFLVSCNNAADSTDRAKDSLDSIANATKNVVDSTADQKINAIDSTVDAKKDQLDSTAKKVDSANKK